MRSSDFAVSPMPLEYQQMLSNRDFNVLGTVSEAIVVNCESVKRP